MRTRRSLLSLLVTLAVLAVCAGFMMSGMIRAAEAAQKLPEAMGEQAGVRQGGDVLVVGDGSVVAAVEATATDRMLDTAADTGEIVLPGEITALQTGQGSAVLGGADPSRYSQIVFAPGDDTFGFEHHSPSEEVDHVLASAAGRPVLWLNDDPTMRPVLEQAQDRHPNLMTYDWETYVSGDHTLDKILDAHRLRTAWLLEAIEVLDT